MTTKPTSAVTTRLCDCDESPFIFDDDGYLVCKTCGGRAPKPGDMNKDYTCPLCAGTGRRDEQPCPVCGGWGILW